MMSSTPQVPPARVAEAMFANDRAARSLGMKIEAVDVGYARISMVVREDFMNGHDVCHGGIMFTLCDTAFAYACNAGNLNTLAAGCNIEFLKPVPLGTTLTAEGRVQVQSGRHGVYDVRLTDDKGQTIALFRGKSAQIGGHVVPPPADGA